MISIIIPIYNAARWLPQCLDSVLGQDYRDIEIILINDASTDKSLLVCEKYQKLDNRVRLINKSVNEGVELARHAGFLQSKGDYVMFIDSDDWLDNSKVLSKMIAKAEETGADYVAIRLQKVIDRFKFFKWPVISPVSGLIANPYQLNQIYEMILNSNPFFSYMASKLYRRSIIDDARIKIFGVIYQEDLIFNLQLFPFLKKIYVIEEIGYNYRYGGMGSRYNPRIFIDLKRNYYFKRSIIEKKKKPYFDHINFELKNVLQSEICQLIEFSGKSKETIISYIKSEIKLPLYDKMLEVNKSSLFWNDPFVGAFKDQDALAIYNICLRQVRKDHPKRMAKRFVAKILQSL